MARLVLKEFYSFARLAIDACPDGLAKIAERIASGGEGVSPSSSRQKWWTERLMKPIAAISDSRETLHDLHFYVTQYPYEGTRVSPMRHLRFNVQSYFQEIYIFRQRLIDLLNIAKKEFETCDDGPVVAQVCDHLCRTLKARIKTIIELRKEHVHSWGCEIESFTWLDACELSLSASNDPPRLETSLQLQSFFEERYPLERQLWGDAIMEINEAMDEMLDDCARELIPIFFNTSSGVRFPQEILS
jgi:hypothetical protein